MNEPYDLGSNHLLALGLRIGALLIFGLILSVTSCTMHRDYQRALALSKGVDPLGISCVYDDTSNRCTLAAASRPRATQ
jgi:hypothetical protein